MNWQTTLNWSQLSSQQKKSVLSRPKMRWSDKQWNTIRQVFETVNKKGDQALRDFTLKWDRITLENIKVPFSKMEMAWKNMSPQTQKAIQQAHENVSKFHKAQRLQQIEVETLPGLICKQVSRPIERIGLYIPGGTAPLISTLIMALTPALLANVPEIVVVTPPSPSGVNTDLLGACYYLGAKEVYQVGGAQAIAALSLGTETIRPVYKIFGPGNSWVTLAKQWATQRVPGLSIDMPAGPSEVLVIADQQAHPLFVALDLLSQAEHGADSQCLLVTPSEKLMNQVQSKIIELTKNSKRATYLKESLNFARFILVKDLDQAVQVSNTYAPEHLIIQTDNPKNLLNSVSSAGSVFLGSFTPESLGDYASGTNHILPTGGYARSVSGLTLPSFLKTMSVQEATKEALLNIAPTVERLAQIEGLEFHEKAVSVRCQNITKELS